MAAKALNYQLADGMVVCSTLPMAINIVVVMTKASDGDEAAAVFNSAFGNFIGVFLSPLLILGYLGVSSSIDLVDVFYKLGIRVLLPVILGQVLRRFRAIKKFATRHNEFLRRVQQYSLAFIAYTVFCQSFLTGSLSTAGDILLMILFQFLLIVGVMVLAWFMLKRLFPDEPRLRVMGLFGCSEKTLSIGIPLIHALYENDPALGQYTLPLLIWHPLQIILGSFMAPRLVKFVQREKERLGIVSEENFVSGRIEAVEEGPIPVTGDPTNAEGSDLVGDDEVHC